MAAGAFLLGLLRGVTAPMTSDAGYHLLRAGNSLLSVSLKAYAVPPGGDHAPLLGAAATAFGALFAGGTGETALVVPGALLLGAAAALVAQALHRRGDPSVTVLGVALLLLPPAVVSSFTYRPDAALAGLLFGMAVVRALDGRAAGAVVTPAWASVLAAPWTLPGAVVLQAAHARARRAWVFPAAVGIAVAVLSAALPAGTRGEILRGLFGEVSFSPDLAGRVDAVRRVWGGGILLAAPIFLPLAVRAARLPRAVVGAAGASALLLLLGGGHGALRAGSAALLPAIALLGALAVGALPDPRAASGPRRPVLFALLLPLLLLLVGAHGDAVERHAHRAATARDVQVAVFLRDHWEEPGDLMAERTGALGALCDRPVRPLTGVLPPEDLPARVVLGDGLLPAEESAAQASLFVDPRFLSRYTPLEFRRGRAVDILDAVWVRVDDVGSAPEAYGRALRRAWEAGRRGDEDATRASFEEAQTHEPAGRARAREGLGLWHERQGHAEQAERYFDAARERDEYAVRARGHLIDRALARGGILRADTLVTETVRFDPYLSEVRGTRARLFAAAGAIPEALSEAEAAVRLAPRSGRALTNWGILLWDAGRYEDARATWKRAIRADPEMLAYLGDFDRASTDLPAPPLLPLFTDVEFDPSGLPGAAPPDPGGP